MCCSKAAASSVNISEKLVYIEDQQSIGAIYDVTDRYLLYFQVMLHDWDSYTFIVSFTEAMKRA